MNILIVEDEPAVASFIKQGLEERSYEVEVAYDGYTGEKLALSRTYDLVILDVVIPHVNGIELCKRIRDRKPDVPILMLTALGTTEDKEAGFDAGADDYLVKPFEFRELVMRIRALTKRTRIGPMSTTHTIRVADLILDLDRKTASRRGKEIPLTAKEFALLQFLMRNKGRVISKIEIAEKVWDLNFDTGTNVVEVYVNILRKKIDKAFDTKLLHTRIGLGYLFSDQV